MVDMVVHERVVEELSCVFFDIECKDIKVVRLIVVRKENIFTMTSTLSHMMRIARNNNSRRACHNTIIETGSK